MGNKHASNILNTKIKVTDWMESGLEFRKIRINCSDTGNVVV